MALPAWGLSRNVRVTLVNLLDGRGSLHTGHDSDIISIVYAGARQDPIPLTMTKVKTWQHYVFKSRLRPTNDTMQCHFRIGTSSDILCRDGDVVSLQT